MATKLEILRQIVIDLGTVYPGLTAQREIYLTPRIMAVESMAPLEIQVCEGASSYVAHESCRSEDFVVRVGIFRKYGLDSGNRHAKALTDLKLSIFKLKKTAIDILDGSFLDGLLTRPLMIDSESAVVETKVAGKQLLKILDFVAGLNVEVI